MITPVKVPKLDTNAEEVTVTGWLKQEGAAVKAGEPLVELTTDKASFEFESPAEGLLRKILAREKSIVPVGFVLAVVGDANETLPDYTAINQELLAKHKPVKSMKPPVKVESQAQTPAPVGLVKATPAARRLAKEKGIDLAKVKADTGADTITEELLMKIIGDQKI